MTNEPTHSPRRLLLVLFLGVLMVALDIAIVGPALPAIQDTFGVSERAIAWVFSMFVLFNLVGLPLMAKLADVFGRRLVYTIDILLFGVGSLVVALSPSFAVLLVGRAIQGMAASGIFPVASAVIGDVFAPERRGRALGVLGAVYGVAFIIGPIIAGLLLKVGWTWLFIINLPVAVVVALVGYGKLPALHRAQGRQLDWAGIATLGMLLAALAYGINWLDTEAFVDSLTSLAVWPYLLLAAVLFPVFLYVERRAPNPLLRLGLLSSRQVVLAGLLAAGAGLTEAAFIFFPKMAGVAFGVSRSAGAYMLLPLTFAVALGAPLAGRLLDRVGSRAIVLAGTACLTLGMGILGLLPPQQIYFYVGTVLVGLGLAALLGSALAYILLSESRVEERTVAQGIITLFISIGQTIGAPMIGAVVASEAGALMGYTQSFLIIAGVTLVLLLLSFGLKKRGSELETARAMASQGQERSVS